MDPQNAFEKLRNLLPIYRFIEIIGYIPTLVYLIFVNGIEFLSSGWSLILWNVPFIFLWRYVSSYRKEESFIKHSSRQLFVSTAAFTIFVITIVYHVAFHASIDPIVMLVRGDTQLLNETLQALLLGSTDEGISVFFLAAIPLACVVFETFYDPNLVKDDLPDGSASV